MASEDSRNIPTSQAKYVGIFRLAEIVGKSDKSAMPTVDAIRRKIREILIATGEKPIPVATSLGFERNHLSDFLNGKKRSLRLEFATAFAERFDVPLKELTPTSEKLSQIRKGKHPHLYIAEHMEARHFDDADMANRIEGIEEATFANWRKATSKLLDWQIAAILHAFDMADISELAQLPPPRVPKKAPQEHVKSRRRA